MHLVSVMIYGQISLHVMFYSEHVCNFQILNSSIKKELNAFVKSIDLWMNFITCSVFFRTNNECSKDFHTSLSDWHHFYTDKFLYEFVWIFQNKIWNSSISSQSMI